MLAAAISLLPAQSFSATAATNVALQNPGFEDALTGWEQPKGVVMGEASTEAAYSGNLGLRIDDNSERAGSSVASARHPISPGTLANLAFMARCTSGSGVAVYLRFFDADGKYLNPAPRNTDFVVIQTKDWTPYTLDAVAPQGAVAMDVWIRSWTRDISVSDYDDFKLTLFPEGSTPRVTAAMRREAEKPTWVRGTETLPAFPKPDPKQAFAETGLKVFQPDGSLLRKPQENWERAKTLVSTDPEWAQWAQERKDTIDDWMAKHNDRTEWQAGWYHDFVSPKDGSFLIWTEDVPTIGTSRIQSRSGHEVEVTPKIFGGWVMMFRNNHASRMVDAARLYRLTGEERYLDWVTGQLDFYADNYEQWPLLWSRKHPARLGVQALDDAALLTRMVDAARLVFDDVPPEQREKWHKKLFAPQAQMLGESYHVIHNIATWMRSAQTQVALLYEDEALWQWAVEGPYGLRAQLQKGITSDYFWYEQSMHYNIYVANAVLPTLVFAGLTGQGERLEEEAAIIQNLLLSPATIRFADDLRLPSPADATSIPRVPVGLLGRAARILPTTLGLAYGDSQKSWDTLVDSVSAEDYDLTLESVDELLPQVTSRNMESSQFALIKDGKWQVFFHYGQLLQPHAQREPLNWSASFDGIDISHDPGTTGYGSRFNAYFRSSMNHNVPTVNGEGQARWARGKLLEFEAGGNGVAPFVSASQPNYRPGVCATRTLRIEGDALLEESSLTFAADASAKQTGRPGMLLHLQGKALLPANFKPATDFTDNRPDTFGFWENVTSARFTDKAQVAVQFADDLVLEVEFTVPGEFVLYSGSSPDYPPLRRDAFFLERLTPAQPGETVILKARLAPPTKQPAETPEP